jgi:hypothetical protein
LVLLAILFLFEAWLWSHLEPVVEWIVACIPLRELKAKLSAWVDVLPPPAALVVFAVPGALLFPLKVVAIWLPPPHAARAGRAGPAAVQNRCTRCGANSPIPMKPRPARPSTPAK